MSNYAIMRFAKYKAGSVANIIAQSNSTKQAPFLIFSTKIAQTNKKDMQKIPHIFFRLFMG